MSKLARRIHKNRVMKNLPYREIVRMRLVGEEIPFPKPRYAGDCHRCKHIYRIPIYENNNKDNIKVSDAYYCAKSKFFAISEREAITRHVCHFFKGVPENTDAYPNIDPISKTLIEGFPTDTISKRIQRYCLRHFKKNRQLCQKSHNGRKKKSA